MKHFLMIAAVLVATTLGAQTTKENPPFIVTGTYDRVAAVRIEGYWTSDATGGVMEILDRDRGKPVELLRIWNAKGKLLLIVHMDGSTTAANDFNADEAAEIFWRTMAAYYYPVCDEAKDKMRGKK